MPLSRWSNSDGPRHKRGVLVNNGAYACVVGRKYDNRVSLISVQVERPAAKMLLLIADCFRYVMCRFKRLGFDWRSSHSTA